MENDHADEEYSCSFEEDVPTPSASSCSASESSSEESLTQNDNDHAKSSSLTSVSKLDNTKEQSNW